MKLHDTIITKTAWEISEDTFVAEGIINSGSNFMIGNGYLGVRSTFESWGKDCFSACTVTDTWDRSEPGRMSELCNVPHPLYARVIVDGYEIALDEKGCQEYVHSLDLRYGVNCRSFKVQLPSGKTVRLQTEKFASYDCIQLLPSRIVVSVDADAEVGVVSGIDYDVWSINGNHFSSIKDESPDAVPACVCKTVEDEIEIAVVSALGKISHESELSDVYVADKKVLRSCRASVAAGEEFVVERHAYVFHSNNCEQPYKAAIKECEKNTGRTFSELLEAHKPHWDELWCKNDVVVEGDIEDALLVRFNLFMALIATPLHDYLPIGARGLSCQVYQGAAFWDQEIFNLPMYIYSNPEVARKILMYRYITLDGARRKAAGLGYKGAFYAWTSGKTGDELFPDFFFTDVLTGRPIRNHFNCWQIHISQDISYAIINYLDVTGDWDFVRDYGAEILFEVAQFIVSRIYFKKDKDRYEFIRLLGPDEYHENVDNNAYTNYISKFVLDKTLEVFRKMKKEDPAKFDSLKKAISLPDSAEEDWQDIVDKIYLPEADPKTLLIEQFDGYFQREDIMPDDLKKRLLDPGEYWGWPNGIAVNTQVLKQADLLQLFAILDIFPHDVIRANYDYYEPRTEHGSSLSPSVHSIVAAKVGNEPEAYRYFKEASSIDLFAKMKKVNSGGSFLGGIHTAAAGGVWMMAVQGFAGFMMYGNGIHISPKMPKNWSKVSFSVVFQARPLFVEVWADRVQISSEESVSIKINGSQQQIAKGEQLTLPV